MADLISETAGRTPAAKIDLVASTRSFIVGLGGALTGITGLMYACGYLVYGAWKVRQMTPAEAAASTDWTHTYIRPRASQRKTDHTIPALVAGAAALLLRDHGDNHPPAPSPDLRTGATQGGGSPQPAPAAPATPAFPPYGPRPASPASGVLTQRSGLCCLPGGGSTQASPLACTARQSQFYPAGTSPSVCPGALR